jgi:hypothetical protein
VDVAEALVQINNSLQALSKRGSWTTYLPLIAAVIATLTAIASTKASVWFSSRRLELNCARALLAEVRGINSEIKSAIASEQQRDFVRVGFLAVSDRICPVYRGVATTVGLLKGRVIQDVVVYYSAILTLRPIFVADQNVKDAFLKGHLLEVCKKGDVAISTIESEYRGKIT